MTKKMYTIRIDPEILEGLKQFAVEEGERVGYTVSVSAVIEKALSDLLKTRKGKTPRP